jgi:hypothetical protein
MGFLLEFSIFLFIQFSSNGFLSIFPIFRMLQFLSCQDWQSTSQGNHQLQLELPYLIVLSVNQNQFIFGRIHGQLFCELMDLTSLAKNGYKKGLI